MAYEQQYWTWPDLRNLLIALGLSLSLHALIGLIFGLLIPEYFEVMIADTPQQHRLEARLQHLPPARPKMAPKKIESTRKPVKNVTHKTVDRAAAPSLEAEGMLSNASSSSTESGDAKATEQATESIQTEENSTAAFIFPENAEDIAPVPPDAVELVFDVRRGSEQGVIGNGTMRFQRLPDGKYEASSKIEPKGIIALFFGDLVQKSTGQITENGLRPESFFYQFGKRASKLRTARFAWEESMLYLQDGGKASTANLVSGSQDLLSVLFQFMFEPPMVSTELMVTNGRNLRDFQYTFEGEESLLTPLGMLNTWHLLNSRGDREDKIELWLAVDYHYLPIKIRKVEKDGKVYEQTMTELRIDHHAPD